MDNLSPWWRPTGAEKRKSKKLQKKKSADFTEALKPVENLFADADTFADYVAGIRNRGWVDALTLHLAAALWGRRILVVQDKSFKVL